MSPPALNHNKGKLFGIRGGVEGLESDVSVFFVSGHFWYFMRPPGARNGAKQELEQFRVDVNPSRHKQLKMILASKEAIPLRSFLFLICHFFSSYSLAYFIAFPLNVQTEKAPLPIVCVGAHLLRMCSFTFVVG